MAHMKMPSSRKNGMKASDLAVANHELGQQSDYGATEVPAGPPPVDGLTVGLFGRGGGGPASLVSGLSTPELSPPLLQPINERLLTRTSSTRRQFLLNFMFMLKQYSRLQGN